MSPFFDGEQDETGPGLVVSREDSDLIAAPHVHCTTENVHFGACNEVFPPESEDSIPLGDEPGVALLAPRDWTIEARLTPDGHMCNGSFELQVGDRMIEDLGAAGIHLVHVSGSGLGEEAAWFFSITSDRDRPFPAPVAHLHWSPGAGNAPSLTPLWVAFGNLDGEPTEVAGSVLVTTKEGNAHSFDLIEVRQDECWTSSVTMEA